MKEKLFPIKIVQTIYETPSENQIPKYVPIIYTIEASFSSTQIRLLDQTRTKWIFYSQKTIIPVII